MIWVGIAFIVLLILGLHAFNRSSGPIRRTTFSAPVAMATHRACDFPTVGVQFHRHEIEALVGWTDHNEIRDEVVLRPEPKNPHGAEAIAVEMRGRKVAYVSKDRAIEYHKYLDALDLRGRSMSCKGRISR